MTRKEALEQLKKVADSISGCVSLADRLGATTLGDELEQDAALLETIWIVLGGEKEKAKA